ncbi:thioredoxin family protein [Limibacterium fermenti]|uniref:thioredoxin family protein n=1 Tax=Limibacterium fermenti TaxID=3229863 RepID=UPI003A754810
MKKISLIFSILLFSLSILSQTNFRNISYDEALAIAKAEKKFVFIDFYTVWCGPCKMMDKQVFPQKKVGDFLDKYFICIKLDAEKEGAELAAIHKLKSYPTYIGVDTDENVMVTKIGASDADELIASIERQINPEKSSERLKERYRSGERSAELIVAYVSMKIEELWNEESNPTKEKQEAVFDIVRDYFTGLNDTERLSEENVFVYNYITSPTDAMAQYMIANRNRFALSIKNQIENRINQMLNEQLIDYLTATVPYDESIYQFIKKNILDSGLNKENTYTAAFRLIESHAKKDLNAYLALCEEIFSDLPKRQQASLLTHFSSNIDTEDEFIRKRASKFIRSQLHTLEANMIYFVAMDLIKIEEGIDKQE